MKVKEFRDVLLFMCNQWSLDKCIEIYNIPGQEWQYSQGWYIWNKWVEIINDRGSLNGIAYFFLETLDNECLQKLIDYSINYYKK